MTTFNTHILEKRATMIFMVAFDIIAIGPISKPQIKNQL
jgi:hypothetical protein